MSDEKVVEAVGRGRVHLCNVLARAPITDGKVRPAIAKVRVQKVRDGKVYEDVTMEVAPSGFHG